MLSRPFIGSLVFVAGCWRASEFPISVRIDPNLEPEQVATIVDAVYKINSDVDRRVLKLGWTEGSDDGIFISHAEPLMSGLTGDSYRLIRHCRVRLGSTVSESVVIHEIGHCFELDHDDDPRSVMYPRPPGPLMTQEHISAVRARVDGAAE